MTSLLLPSVSTVLSLHRFTYEGNLTQEITNFDPIDECYKCIKSIWDENEFSVGRVFTWSCKTQLIIVYPSFSSNLYLLLVFL